MAKKFSLPEHVIADNKYGLSVQAKLALDSREKVNEWNEKEKDAKEKIATDAEILRQELLEDGQVAGKISIAPPNQTAVRVEFRINNGSLAVEEMDNLDRLFGNDRPELFEKVQVVTVVDDPCKLIEVQEPQENGLTL